MLQLKRILCPTDLTRESDEAMRYAVALAIAYEAKLILLNCTRRNSKNQPFDSRILNPTTLQAFDDSLRTHLGTTLITELDWEGVSVENVDDPGEVIAQQAGILEVDLIVMRSRRRPRAAVLLGSTAETVSRLAPCPVLVTHPQEREWVGFSTGEIDLNRILVTHDFSSGSELALNYAVLLAQQYQAQLHLLHVRHPAYESSDEQDGQHSPLRSDNLLAASRLQRAVPRQVSLWCRVVSAVRFGKTPDEVLSYAQEHKIDLICMGANSDQLSAKTLLGSNVDRVLRRAPCPIFIARKFRPDVAERLMSQKKTEGASHDYSQILHRS